MRPAFSSSRQAAAFALLLLLLLLAPVVAGKRLLPPREEIYSSIPWSAGDFPYLDGQIFRQRGDLDIVFMGASHVWGAFDTPYVQEQLSKNLGRTATVRTFAWGWPDFDAIYFVARDLFNHRKVRMLVLDDNYNELDLPHPLSPYLFRFGDDADALDGLPLPFKAAYYFASIVGMPRNLLDLARPNLPADMHARSYWEIRAKAPNLAGRLGSIQSENGFRSSPDAEPEPFVPFVPKTGVRPSDVCVYSPETRTNFLFSDKLPPMQLHFARLLAALVRSHDCRLVIVHIPVLAERNLAAIPEPVFWPEALHAQVTMVGIPPATLFKGLSDDQVRKLYSDSVHFNKNGQNYFTGLMTPELLKIYASNN